MTNQIAKTTAKTRRTSKRQLLARNYLEACKIENIEERKAALRALGFDPL